jgi:aminoglycoside phosphotransferase (APT) family kinase protein
MTLERLPAALTSPPPPRALGWVLRSAAPGGRIIRIRRLRGGSSAALHAIDVQAASGTLLKLVLRRFVIKRWLDEEPDLAEREARVIRLLAAAPVPTPELIAVDEDGSECGVPALVMTRLPGRLDVAPRDMDGWLRQLANPLPGIHSVRGEGIELVQRWFLYYEMKDARPPQWTRRRQVWERAIEVVNGPRPDFDPVFIHRDYHPLNVLWRRGRISAVLDWTNASVGPASVDVAHCNTNLVVLFGPEAAERFTALYESLTGRKHDPYWDLLSLCDTGLASHVNQAEPEEDAVGGLSQFHDAGRLDLTTDAVHARVDEYVESLVRRLV